jgi:hypothetical protein
MTEAVEMEKIMRFPDAGQEMDALLGIFNEKRFAGCILNRSINNQDSG